MLCSKRYFYSVFSETQFCWHEECNFKSKKLPKIRGCLPKQKGDFFVSFFVFGGFVLSLCVCVFFVEEKALKWLLSCYFRGFKHRTLSRNAFWSSPRWWTPAIGTSWSRDRVRSEPRKKKKNSDLTRDRIGPSRPVTTWLRGGCFKDAKTQKSAKGRKRAPKGGKEHKRHPPSRAQKDAKGTEECKSQGLVGWGFSHTGVPDLDSSFPIRPFFVVLVMRFGWIYHFFRGFSWFVLFIFLAKKRTRKEHSRNGPRHGLNLDLSRKNGKPPVCEIHRSPTDTRLREVAPRASSRW